MAHVLRPRRSALFVPAANARALEKSAELSPDTLIFDLEDSALPDEKVATRERLREHLAQTRHSSERLVRINPFGTPLATEDLMMALSCRVDGIVLPKLEAPQSLDALARALDECDAPKDFVVLAMIESPRAIFDLPALMGCSGVRRLSGLLVGPQDLELASGVKPGPGRAELVPWLMQIVLAAKARGLQVLDGAYPDFRDAEGFSVECVAGRRMGFDGKTLIHPGQIEAANTAFRPSPEQVADARAIVEAFARPEHADKGIVALDGRMLERLHLRGAEALLELDARLGERKDAS